MFGLSKFWAKYCRLINTIKRNANLSFIKKEKLNFIVFIFPFEKHFLFREFSRRLFSDYVVTLCQQWLMSSYYQFESTNDFLKAIRIISSMHNTFWIRKNKNLVVKKSLENELSKVSWLENGFIVIFSIDCYPA